MQQDLLTCAECGHLHWTGTEYITCPIRDCICGGCFAQTKTVRAPRLRLDARGHTYDYDLAAWEAGGKAGPKPTKGAYH